MSAFLIYFICSFLFVIFYITRDEIRRARDKRSGALVKRLPRSEPWVWSIYIPLVGGMNIYMFTHLCRIPNNRCDFCRYWSPFRFDWYVLLRNQIPQVQPRQHHHLPRTHRKTPHHPHHRHQRIPIHPQNPTVPTRRHRPRQHLGSGTTKATPSPPTPHAV